MAKSLVSVRQLVSDGWSQYLHHWNHAMEVSLWLLLFPLLQIALVALTADASLLAAQIIGGVLGFLDAVFTLWITIRLIRLAQSKNAKEEGSIVRNLKSGWDILLPFLWVTLLNSMAVLGGTMVFVLPGIWMGVIFCFAQFIILDDGRRGFQALAASAALVKGRFWPTLWRIVVPGVLFMTLVIVALWVVSLLVGLLAGFGALGHMLDVGTSVDPTLLTPDMLKAQAMTELFDRLPQALFLPVFIFCLSKLYLSLKETR